jgi:hypothetical protein
MRLSLGLAVKLAVKTRRLPDIDQQPTMPLDRAEQEALDRAIGLLSLLLHASHGPLGDWVNPPVGHSRMGQAFQGRSPRALLTGKPAPAVGCGSPQRHP